VYYTTPNVLPVCNILPRGARGGLGRRRGGQPRGFVPRSRVHNFIVPNPVYIPDLGNATFMIFRNGAILRLNTGMYTNISARYGRI
jgi:hypothetical protein